LRPPLIGAAVLFSGVGAPWVWRSKVAAGGGRLTIRSTDGTVNAVTTSWPAACTHPQAIEAIFTSGC